MGLLYSSSMKDKDYITTHVVDTSFTELHSNCSLRSSRGFFDLESLALAMSLWQPNASLLFCRVEVLMLLKSHCHGGSVLDK